MTLAVVIAAPSIFLTNQVARMTQLRKHVHSGAPWESLVGYSRAVRCGNQVAVSGTAPVGEDGEVVSVGDAYGQASRCLEIIDASLRAAGATISDVVRTRIFVTDISLWQDIGRAHQEMFSEIMPATSMVEVSRLIHPEMLVEIEADAIVAGDSDAKAEKH